MTKDTGGPAFPQKRMYRCSQGIDHEIHEQGMTLRDWFAGQAPDLPNDIPLTSLACIVGRPYSGIEFGSIEHWRYVADAEAAWKGLHADAMIAERNK